MITILVKVPATVLVTIGGRHLSACPGGSMYPNLVWDRVLFLLLSKQEIYQTLRKPNQGFRRPD